VTEALRGAPGSLVYRHIPSLIGVWQLRTL